MLMNSESKKITSNKLIKQAVLILHLQTINTLKYLVFDLHINVVTLQATTRLVKINLVWLPSELLSDCCLTPTQQFYSYVIARTS